MHRKHNVICIPKHLCLCMFVFVHVFYFHLPFKYVLLFFHWKHQRHLMAVMQSPQVIMPLLPPTNKYPTRSSQQRTHHISLSVAPGQKSNGQIVALLIFTMDEESLIVEVENHRIKHSSWSERQCKLLAIVVFFMISLYHGFSWFHILPKLLWDLMISCKFNWHTRLHATAIMLPMGTDAGQSINPSSNPKAIRYHWCLQWKLWGYFGIFELNRLHYVFQWEALVKCCHVMLCWPISKLGDYHH